MTSLIPYLKYSGDTEFNSVNPDDVVNIKSKLRPKRQAAEACMKKLSDLYKDGCEL